MSHLLYVLLIVRPLHIYGKPPGNYPHSRLASFFLIMVCFWSSFGNGSSRYIPIMFRSDVGERTHLRPTNRKKNAEHFAFKRHCRRFTRKSGCYSTGGRYCDVLKIIKFQLKISFSLQCFLFPAVRLKAAMQTHTFDVYLKWNIVGSARVGHSSSYLGVGRELKHKANLFCASTFCVYLSVCRHYMRFSSL